MISANGVEYKNLPEQVQYLTEKAAEFAVELDRVSASVESVTGDVAALQTSYTALAEDVRVAKININTLFVNFGTAFTEITNIKNGTTPLFETITDSHGNKRFVEGDLALSTINGITFSYGKWSLSGTHLMIALAGTITSGTTISSGTLLAIANLPVYISNKLLPIYGAILDKKNITLYNDIGQDVGTLSTYNQKVSNLSRILVRANLTVDVDSYFRIQYDFLIDAS